MEQSMINQDISLDIFLHSIKLHRGHLQFLIPYHNNMQEYIPSKHKLLTDLVKLGYIYESQITKKGSDLVQEVLNWDGVWEPSQKVKKKEIEYSQEFIRFWDNYPASDIFEFKGVLFKGTRKLKVKKEECVEVFEKISEKEKLVDCLKIECDIRMNKSLETGKNEMSYFNNSLVWLNQEKYKLYLPLIGKEQVNKDNRQTVI